MKTLLYTGYDIAYCRLADITLPRMEKYASKHGLDFRYHVAPLINVPHGIYWTGVVGGLNAFNEGYDRAIYLDVDQLITNYDFKLPDWQNGFHVSKDWGEDAIHHWQFSMCGFLAFNSTDELFKQCLSLEPEWRDKPFPEQGPMQYVASAAQEDGPHILNRAPKVKALAKHLNYQGPVIVHPRKVFNCVPDQVCPGKVPEPWAKGDWCAHLTMLPLEERIQLAHNLIKEHGL